ncbi:MAG: PilZ domain-containing protein [Thermodesulfovibrionales bacterium]
MERRKEKRLNAKLYVKVKTNSPLLTCWGVLCEGSPNGLFITSLRYLAMGTVIDMEIILPDLSPCFLKGTVKRVTELPESDRSFGIGVELTGNNVAYARLLKLLDSPVNKTGAKTVTEVSFNIATEKP